ncbi:hypothetical protein LTR66_002168 [Elasticomyces elasticus]|nr:hypothetical protein LTR66_002168 [Elasticomyces elasticus]KAK5007627.1 hypothetical protein LTR28_005049 [Elasticomyces elasticus]
MTAVAKEAESAFTFLPLGAIIHEFSIAGTNIVLNFPRIEDYRSTGNPGYFGETIGRVANRISGAKIESLNSGKKYELKANDGPNCLHGGPQGWGKRDWEGPEPVNKGGIEGVLFTYLSENGEQGFPGTVECRLWYVASKQEDEGVEKTALEIDYEVKLVGDEVEETVVAVTNHSTFTIADGLTIEGTEATLYTNLYQEMDDTGIPTGEIKPFPGIEPDKAFILGAVEPAVDHCFVMNPDPSSIPLDTRQSKLRKQCAFSHPNTRLHFEVLSTEPAFQFYTGEHIDVPAVEGASARGPRAGFCVEPSRYINAVNEEKWRNMVVLKKGEVWGSKVVYRGWKD